MKVLMSIKPKYVEKIFSGEKEWEFRRVVPQPFCTKALIWFERNRQPFGVVIYASAPVKKVVGEMMVDYTECDYAEKLWNFCNEKGKVGISLEELVGYFNDPPSEYDGLGWAMHICRVRKYETPLSLEEAKFIQKETYRGNIRFVEKPPQNFCYIREFNFIK